MKDHGMTVTDIDESVLLIPHATKPETYAVIHGDREFIRDVHAAILAMIDRAVAEAMKEQARP